MPCLVQLLTQWLKPLPNCRCKAGIGSLKSLNNFLASENICTTCCWNLNKIVWTKLHEILNFLTKKNVCEAMYVVFHSNFAAYTGWVQKTKQNKNKQQKNKTNKQKKNKKTQSLDGSYEQENLEQIMSISK